MKSVKLVLLSVTFLMFGANSTVFAANREEQDSNSKTIQKLTPTLREGVSVKKYMN